MSDFVPEWPQTLDVDALLAAKWQPYPFREFVLKIHSRCNLACDYCYMYSLADQSWRHQPVRMSEETVDQSVVAIAKHAEIHRLHHIRVILHGGEPLLAGPVPLRQVVNSLRSRLPTSTSALVSVQTNGVYLTPANLKVLDELSIQVAVSLDGVAADHDRHRRLRNGTGSHVAVAAGLTRLAGENYRHLFRGILCTIDLRNDPIATYMALIEFGPPGIDFLLPHGNWSSPPPGVLTYASQTPYANWLIKIFDYWYDNSTCEVRIRLFDELMYVILGGKSHVDGIGLGPTPVVIIETDGSIEQSDSLKSAYQGATSTGMHVSSDSLDQVLLLPAIAARQLGATALASTCRGCRVHQICGGGHYAHRYLAGRGFDNPSVYCRDLYRLIAHIRHRVTVDLAGLRVTC